MHKKSSFHSAGRQHNYEACVADVHAKPPCLHYASRTCNSRLPTWQYTA